MILFTEDDLQKGFYSKIAGNRERCFFLDRCVQIVIVVNFLPCALLGPMPARWPDFYGGVAIVMKLRHGGNVRDS